MTSHNAVSTTPRSAKPAPRAELEEMMRRWMDAHQRAEATGDWKTTLGAHYTDDAVYRWDVGPDETFEAHGLREIQEVALGYQMAGFEGWHYPYERVVLDEAKGEVVGYWRQVSPFTRADGSRYEVAGLGSSWFRYGGDYKWCEQQDFFDFSCVMALFRELAADGHLPPVLCDKIKRVSRGEPIAGHRPRAHRASPLRKLRGNLALARIALIGR